MMIIIEELRRACEQARSEEQEWVARVERPVAKIARHVTAPMQVGRTSMAVRRREETRIRMANDVRADAACRARFLVVHGRADVSRAGGRRAKRRAMVLVTNADVRLSKKRLRTMHRLEGAPLQQVLSRVHFLLQEISPCQEFLRSRAHHKRARRRAEMRAPQRRWRPRSCATTTRSTCRRPVPVAVTRAVVWRHRSTG